MAPEFQHVADEQLAQCAQSGEWAAFDELVHRFEARIYRFVWNCCGHEADARELTQETFVTAYLNLKRFDVSLSFAAWLFTIARRKCIDRSRRARPVFADEFPELPDANDPSTLLARREAAEDIWRIARRELSETAFQSLWLRYAEDLSVAETARVLRRTQPHVKVILFRARGALARALEHEQPFGLERTGVLATAQPTPNRTV